MCEKLKSINQKLLNINFEHKNYQSILNQFHIAYTEILRENQTSDMSLQKEIINIKILKLKTMNEFLEKKENINNMYTNKYQKILKDFNELYDDLEKDLITLISNEELQNIYAPQMNKFNAIKKY